MEKDRDYIEQCLKQVNEDLIVSRAYNDKLLNRIESYRPWTTKAKEFIFFQKLSLSLICSGLMLMIFSFLRLDFYQINTILNLKIILPFGR